MDKQGYITLARSTNNIDLAEASLLARSIKLADPDREVCLVTDQHDRVPDHISNQFDYLVELPFGIIENEDIDINLWQVYHCTPFHETMWLRKQCLLLDNVDGMWDNCSNYDLLFPSKTLNFKGESKDFLYYFRCHEKNNFSKNHTDIFYFKQSEYASDFFKVLDPVLQDWRSVYVNLIKENKPEYFNLNLLINIALKMFGHTDIHTDHFLYTFLSLENVDLDDHDLPEDWTRYLSCWVKDQKVKVSNHRLTNFVFYNSETFIDKEVLDDFGISS